MSKKKYLPQNIADDTIENYTSAINCYEEYNNMSMEELINEALEEQTNNTPEHQLSIYNRILDFREYNTLRILGSSLVTYETIIKQIYTNNRIRIPKLPRINHRRLLKNPPIEYKDYLSKEELKKAANYLNLNLKARFIGMISSGCSNDEIDHLTTRQFIDDLYKYHQKEDDREALKYLANKNHVHIWVARLTRYKTMKPYYAIFSPEAVQLIALAKLNEKTLKPKLYVNNKKYFAQVLAEINDNHGFGKAGGHRRLRPHMLRKFHATNISGSVLDYGEESALRNFEIDELQGRGKTGVQDRYIKTNPIKLKLLYAKVMNKVCLFNEYDYRFVDGDVAVWVKDHRRENQKIIEENKAMKNQIENDEKVSVALRNYIKEVGYDNFRDGLSELLNQM